MESFDSIDHEFAESSVVNRLRARRAARMAARTMESQQSLSDVEAEPQSQHIEDAYSAQSRRASGISDLLASFSRGPGNALHSISESCGQGHPSSDQPSSDASGMHREPLVITTTDSNGEQITQQVPKLDKTVAKKQIRWIQSAARRVIERDAASKRKYRMRPHGHICQKGKVNSGQSEARPEARPDAVRSKQGQQASDQDGEAKIAATVPGLTRSGREKKTSKGQKRNSGKKARACSGFSDDDSGG